MKVTHLPRIFRFSLYSASALIVVITSNHRANAEGPQDWGDGAHGVNRVVRTLSTGYVEVEGTFAVTSMSLPTREDPTVKAHKNKPNPYLGGIIDGRQFDAGLIYEPDDILYAGGVIIPKGWAPMLRGQIVRGTDYTTQPRVWMVPYGRNPSVTPPDSMPWRGGDGLITSFEKFQVYENDGAVSITIGAVPNGGLFFHNNDVGANVADANNPIAPYTRKTIVDIGNLASANVKRVTAMTKATEAETDGAEMTVTFSGGRVRKHGQASSHSWKKEDVNHDTSGYDAPGNGTADDGAWDALIPSATGKLRKSAISHTRVEFPKIDAPVSNIEARTNSDASQSALEGGNSRYTRETVQINLRTATKMTGEEMK